MTGGGSLASSDSAIAEVFSSTAIVIGLLVVLLGGLALNLTPCVYPLIGVTIAYFGNEGGAPRKVIVLASLYVLGIALMFSASRCRGRAFGRPVRGRAAESVRVGDHRDDAA